YRMAYEYHRFNINGTTVLDIQEAGIGITERLYHRGDPDTHLKFGSNTLSFHAGSDTDRRFLVGQTLVRFENLSNGVDINADLDVDGHTNLDNVSIAGVTTITGTLGSSDITITSNQPKLSLTDSSNNPDWSVKNANGNFAINDETAGATRFSINSSNGVEFHMHAVPSADSTYDLGLTGTRWR
ncbi:MAG: hypothetical protein VXY93_20605, partial [Pseudomonadota bacterium]|nr:hypothetical protein [Pseudomonadota bacterium]